MLTKCFKIYCWNFFNKVNKFGCRAVTIAGAVIGAIGIAASALATNVAILYLTIGVLTGYLTMNPDPEKVMSVMLAVLLRSWIRAHISSCYCWSFDVF
jgi:hypothetical protein